MDKNFYSPTMLTRYINCKHIISNEYYESQQYGFFDREKVIDGIRKYNEFVEVARIEESNYLKEKIVDSQRIH